MKDRPGQQGFTLIEMLVALALVSTIVTMVYGSFTAASRSMDLYSRRMACCERTCLVLRLMARQLRCAYLPSSERQPMPTSPQNGAPSASVPATAPQIKPLEASGGILSFVTTVGVGTGSAGSMALSRVMYRYDPSAGTLSISCEPCVYGGGRPQDSQSWRPILGGVQSVDMQFYDGRQWRSGWTGGESRALPQSVRIAITVVDERNHPHEFKTMTPIGCRNTPQPQQVRTSAMKS